MTIVNGDLIYASDFTDLVSKINSKINEANRNNANISSLELDRSHPIRRDENIHHENANRIIDKYNDLLTNSENMSDSQLLDLVSENEVIQNSFQKFKTINDTIDNVLFEAAVGSLIIKGPVDINEDSSDRYVVDKAVEGGIGWEQVPSSQIDWSISGSGGSFATISTTGYLKTTSIPSDQTITINATYIDDYGTHTASKDIAVHRILEVESLEIQSIDGSGEHINEGEKHRYICIAILDQQGNTQVLTGGFDWRESNRNMMLIDDVFDDPEYPGIKVAELTVINVEQEIVALNLEARYKRADGVFPLQVHNSAAIVRIFIEDEDEDAEIRTVEGDPQTLRAYGFSSDNDRDAVLLDQEDLTWEITQNNNTGSRFDDNQFVPGTMISGDTPVIIKCTYRKGTSEAKYITREIIIEKNAEVVAIAIYRQGSSDDPLSALNVLEDSETQLGCTVYFSDNASDTDPDSRFVSWSFDNVSDAVLSGSGIDSETGLLETGEISQDLSLQLRVSYRGFDGTREVIVRNINSVKIGTYEGDTDTEITIDEGTSFPFRLFALHNAGQTMVGGDIEWEFWKDNSSYNPPFADINRTTGEVSANNRVNKDELLQLKCTWITARTERMYTAYKAIRFHDTNYPISLEIEVPGILYEGQSMFLTAKATLDNGDEITVDKDDTAMNWSITNYNGISSNLLSINSEGMLTLGNVDFNTNTILVKGTYAKNGVSKNKPITVELQGIYVESLDIYGVNMNRVGMTQSTTLKCRQIYNYGPPTETIDEVIWSIDGDKKGCNINSSSGLLTAGSQPGLITISVYKDGITANKNLMIIDIPRFELNGSSVTRSGGEYIFDGTSTAGIKSNTIQYSDMYIEVEIYQTNFETVSSAGAAFSINSDLGGKFWRVCHERVWNNLHRGEGYLSLGNIRVRDDKQGCDFFGVYIKDRNIQCNFNGLWSSDHGRQNISDYNFSLTVYEPASVRTRIRSSGFRAKVDDKIYGFDRQPIDNSIFIYYKHWDRHVYDLSSGIVTFLIKVSDVHYFSPGSGIIHSDGNDSAYENVTTGSAVLDFVKDVNVTVNGLSPTSKTNDKFYWSSLDLTIDAYSWGGPKIHKLSFGSQPSTDTFEIELIMELNTPDNDISKSTFTIQLDESIEQMKQKPSTPGWDVWYLYTWDYNSYYDRWTNRELDLERRFFYDAPEELTITLEIPPNNFDPYLETSGYNFWAYVSKQGNDYCLTLSPYLRKNSSLHFPNDEFIPAILHYELETVNGVYNYSHHFKIQRYEDSPF